MTLFYKPTLMIQLFVRCRHTSIPDYFLLHHRLYRQKYVLGSTTLTITFVIFGSLCPLSLFSFVNSKLFAEHVRHVIYYSFQSRQSKIIANVV